MSAAWTHKHGARSDGCEFDGSNLASAFGALRKHVDASRSPPRSRMTLLVTYCDATIYLMLGEERK